ncbi:two-component regulator propeller domain-containing protein [Mucilaginibacter sabulilitoris]|uniref:histidine kinase n=1 Tax=Mucilaginibacter sabulilitoris TaxID=1173583 RepID=A0ABZ0TWA8_9SPHI|nr:two-component regulator propeller domain-containing protein [Mucilaginibacter sabulilitoris]WPU96109.1 two-component regulator propeller domain-containing protein [Mucilaginibacter sabulilitoris]
MKYNKLLILFFFILYNAKIARCQPLSYIGIDQGLSNNSVRCIYQDHKGFLWFGTYDGLNRYDGYSFKIFRNKFKDTGSLINNYIFSITEDEQSNMWIGTHGGVCIYNNLSGKFSTVSYIPRAGGQSKQINVGVRVIKPDQKGNMLLGTLGIGLLFKDKSAQPAVEIPINKGKEQLWDYDVQAIKPDNKGRMWVFIPQVGLCRLSNDRHKLVIVSSSVRNAYCIEPDLEGNVWIGTGEGLFFYQDKSGLMTKVLDQGKGKLTFSKVSDMVLDNKGQLWMTINGGGVNIYNTLTQRVNYLRTDNGISPLSNDAAYTIYQDKDNRFWIGTLNGGVNVIDPQKGRFKTLSHDAADQNSLPKKAIYALYEDINDDLWIGTEGAGIAIWNRKTNVFSQLKNETENIRSLSDNFVTNIIRDEKKNIWVGTFFNGINRYNRSSRTFKRYKCINPLSNTENRVVSTMCEDQDKHIWVGTLKGDGINGALYTFDEKENRFIAFDTNLSDLWSLTPDNEGRLWAGTLTKLVQIDRNTKKHQFFELGYYLRNIYEDRRHNFWIGTEGGGLVLFDRAKSAIIARYTTEDGLCNNSVLNILEDKEGELWLSTFNGLSKFNPRTKTFKNYYKNDGLQSNQFHYNSKAVLHTGELVFGGIDGVNVFYPEKVTDISSTPKLVLSAIAVNNIELEKNADWVRNISADAVKKIEVPYDKAVFAFDFTALEYTAPDKIKYAYYMEGWDRGWTYSEHVRSANYTHLNEGNYTFRVKCTNAEGSWMSEQISLNIHVLPPWYRSWWAYGLYLIGIIGAIYGYLFYQKKQTQLQYEVKFVKELNEKKIAFFTNISHELRTPLTLIVNPIKDLLHNNGTNIDLIDISAVYRNSRRLLSLVDQLLLFRSSENEVADLNPVLLNLKDVCYEVFLCFNNQVKAKKIDYQFLCNDCNIKINADREKLEIVLFNLLSNAIKYTPEYGSVSIEVNNGDEFIEILVKDTGYGIPEKTGEKLFEKFYRLNQEADKVKESGFGVGLFLAKTYLELHHGKLSYTSVLGKGTTFKISLPKIDDQILTDIDGEPENQSTVTYPLLLELITEPHETSDSYLMTSATHIDEIMNDVVNKKSIILLIDDDIEVRRYIKHLLQDEFIIHEAGNTEAGFKTVLECEPDIIVCDVIMNGVNGVEFCSKMKESPSFSHIPIILLTGSSSPEIKLKGIECGADDYITKPFESDLLIARIKSMLKGRSTLKNYFFNEITLKNNSLKIPVEYSEFLAKCIRIIESHLEDESFSLKAFTDEIGMSRSKLFRKIKSISGLSSTEFIRYIRLRKGAELMIQTDLQIKEIAFKIGFQDIKYFREQFNRLFEMNPSDFIRKYRKTFINKDNLNTSISYSRNKH